MSARLPPDDGWGCDMGTYTIPNVVERTPQGERSYDVFSRLLSERIIFLGTEIDDGVANVVIAQLLHLESASPESEVAIYINSPGGSFTSLMAIYDTMTYVQAPISTFCVGQAASTAAVLLAGGDPGRRFVLEHARVLLGQPATGEAGAWCPISPSRPRRWSGSARRSRRSWPGTRTMTSRRCARTWTATRCSPRRKRWRTGWPTRW